MSLDAAEAVDRQLVETLRGLADAPPPAHLRAPGAPLPGCEHLTGEVLVDLIDSQMLSRHIDLEARRLRAENEGFYTIASAGHEANAVVGALTRESDPAFLHYRSGAFMAQRSKKVPGVDFVKDTLLSLMASADEPISGGRHKVWGSRALWVPPQTSTIASHLPKAVGAAVAIGRSHHKGLSCPVPSDSLVVCSFGDASLNHSTAQGALNSAAWMAYQRLPLPLLFLCEDNGTGISVPTPTGWVERRLRGYADLSYYRADGRDLLAAYETCAQAVADCRRFRRPVFLHLDVQRLLGHAGSDVEVAYRTLRQIQEGWARDPLLRAVRAAVEVAGVPADELLERYESLRTRVRETSAALRPVRRLETPSEIMEALAPADPVAVAEETTRDAGAPAADAARPLPFGASLNRGLHEALRRYPEALVFGEDVAKKGGVYGVTSGLWKTFGAGRVFNTLLDEQAILGLASGAGHLGFLPIPEIQYLAYLHNAIDQVRGEACSLQFFSKDQFRNPMVIRIASYGYQKGFGGHFHNDNALAALREIPGLVIASPSRGDDAVEMLRTCLALAKVDGRVVAFLEPIALYHQKDLHEEGDGGWSFPMPAPGRAAPLGEGRLHDAEAPDLTVVSYANGLWLSLRAAARLRREHGIRARVLDLRWLAPLPLDWVAEHAAATGKLLVVDECRRSGGVAEALVAGVVERLEAPPRTRILAGHDTYIPLGPAMNRVLPSEEDVVTAARALAAPGASAARG